VHESIGHPNESDRVFGREAAQAGTSYINGGNLGLKVGSEAVTIIDEPQISGSNGYYKYDDEGVIGRKKTIIKKGIQNELLTNREYAAMLGTKEQRLGEVELILLRANRAHVQYIPAEGQRHFRRAC
jgi:Predicted Zn-dependent proteases and their inactivated homologs